MSARNRPVLRRHRFEPARLVLGLALLGIAAVHLLRAAGVDERVPLPVLIGLLPAALLLSGVVAVVSLGTRRTGRKDAETLRDRSGTGGRNQEERRSREPAGAAPHRGASGEDGS